MALGVVLGGMGCRESGQQSAPLPLTVAVQPAPYSGLIAVADEQGFFTKGGLRGVLKEYPSGLEALQAVMRGEAQVATVADIALARMMRKDASLRVVAAIGASTGSQIVARKDRNIHGPADLAGKRIGFSPDTSSHYFLHSFLLLHHVPEHSVTMVAIPPARQVEAGAGGEVDAVSAFDVFANLARKKLGENAVAWDAQNTLAYQWLLVTRKSEVRSPEGIQRLLRALLVAEDFAVNHGEETRSILARKWNLDPHYVQESWEHIRLFVSFNQSIVTALQGYVKWAMASDGSTEAPPDVLSYLDSEPMEAVDSKLVTLFR
ncbi:ABC transporter substrate-binding protein [bacterium]|nr:ABC transporter substrate-binding protein [bacterium]